MKKKTVIAVLSVVAAAASFGAACNNQKDCEHENWQTKSGNGFHYLECADCGEKKDYALHVDAKNNETQADGADGKCDVCGADVDVEVVPEWKYDDENHWIEADGNKVGLGGHVDENADGRCDTCGRVNKLTVTFDNGGKTENTSSTVEHGSAVTKPADPKASGWVFEGWYADAECETAYNFTAPVTGAITVYAKWSVDTTPGLNPLHPLTAELDTEKNVTFGTADKLYFSYTAAAAGRYSVSLIALGDKCTFATDLDEDEYTTVGSDATYFDLAENESVVLEVTRGENVKDDDLLIVYFSHSVGEPLPASWVSGSYENEDAGVVVLLDYSARTVTYDEKEAQLVYVGGANASAVFTIEGVRYTLTPKADGVLAFRGGSRNCDLTLFVEPEPIPVSKFSGIYKPASSGAFPGLSEVCIYSNGNGYLVLNGNKQNCEIGDGSTTYNQKRNILTYYHSYEIRLVLGEDGTPEYITVKSGNTKADFSYKGVSGDPVPAKLPVTEGITYYGYDGNTLFADSFGAKINGGSYYLKIASYIAAENKYSLTSDDGNYTVIIEGEGDTAVIKLLDTDGEVADTLEAVTVTYHDLTLTKEEQTITLNTSDFLRDEVYYYEVQETGFYKFSRDTENFELRKMGTNLVKPNGVLISFNPEDDSVKLSEGDKIVVSVANEETKPASITFKVKEGLPPKGTAASNPITVDASAGVVNYKFDLLSSSAYSYVEFNNVAPGEYFICISKDSNYQYYFNIDGKEYGCTYANWSYNWFNGVETLNYYKINSNEKNFYISLTIEEGTDKIAFAVKKTSGSETDVTVRLWNDPIETAADLTFDVDKGSLSASGNFKFDGLSTFSRSESVTFTCESELTVYMDGKPTTGTKITLTDAQLKGGFTVVVPEGKTVNYAVDFELGAQQNPYKFNSLGESSVKQVAGQSTYVEIDLSEYPSVKDFIIGFGSNGSLYYFQINGTGEKYGYGITNDVMGPLTNVKLKYSVTDDASKKFLIVIASDSPKADNNGLRLTITADVESEARELSFNNIPIGESLISFASANVAAGNSNWVIRKNVSASMILTAPSPFSIMLANGTTQNAQLTNGNYVIENFTVSNSADSYFKIISEEAQLIVVATSYAHGSEGYPYTISFTDGAYRFTPAASGSYYMTIEAGTYLLKSNGYFYIADGTPNEGIAKQNGTITVNGTYVARFYTGNNVQTLTLKLAVPESLRRDYIYTDGRGEEHTFTMLANTFTDGVLEYTLTETDGDEYTFTAMSGDTPITATLNLGANKKFNDYDMEIYVPEIFTAEQAGTYKGEFMSNPISITFDLAGKGEMTILDDNLSATKYAFTKMKVNGDGTYTITSGSKTVSMVFTDTGVKITDSSLGASYNLAKYYVFTEEQAGNYAGSTNFGVDVSMKIDRNGKGELNMLNNNLEIDTIVFDSLKVNGDGTYTITGAKGDYTFTFDNGDVTFTSIPGLTLTITMQKTHMFTADQAGTYTGSFFGELELTFDVDGKGTMTMPLSGMGNGTSTETFDKIVDNGNGTYTINDKVTFKFTSEGIQVTSLPIMGATAANLTKEVPQGAAIELGDYVGELYTGFNVKLTIKENLNAEFILGVDSEDEVPFDVVLKATDDGNYTFTASDFMGDTVYTVVVNSNGTLTLTDVAAGNTGVLEKA